MPARLNHIGIALANQEALSRLKRFFAVLGLSPGVVEPVPEQGVVTHFVDLPREPAHLEFLEVTDPAGTVARFIQKRGPGVHHLSFLLDPGELDRACSVLRGEGYRLIYAEPRKGAHDMRINFVHPSTTGGVLVELMEPDLESGAG